MNERIFHMARQSGATDENGKYAVRVFCFTKDELNGFAQLIVRECAKVCRNQTDAYALPLDRENCASAIEEHFGVEE